jgi:hypothetical protein
MIPPNQPCRSTSQNCHSTPNFDHSVQNTLPFDTPMLPFPMFRLRQSRPHSQLPSASVQYLSVPATCARHLHRSARHSSTCDLASLLPRVTSHASPIANSFRIRTSEKHAPNPFRIRTSKTQDLKPFRMNTSEKTPRGRGPVIVNQITADQPRHLQKFGRTHQSHSRAFASSFLDVLLDEKSFSKLIPAHEGLRGAESIEQILNFPVLVNLLGRTKYVCRNDLQGV